MNNDGAAFGRFFGGGFDGACATLAAPMGAALSIAVSSISSTGAGRLRFGFCSRGATASLDEGGTSGGGTAAPPPLTTDFIARGVTKLSGIIGDTVSTGCIFGSVFGLFAEDWGLFVVVGAVKNEAFTWSRSMRRF